MAEAMEGKFNISEIQSICFSLGVDYEDLGGSTKSGKIRELIGYLQRRGTLQNLTVEMKQRRPQVDWDNLPAFGTRQKLF